MVLKNERVIESYRKVIPHEYNLKYILYKIRRPIVAGITIYENFLRITKTDSIVRKPLYNDHFLGAHAVLMIGYNDLNKTLTVVNSHGKDFGDNGKFYMSYDMITDDKLLFETWVINT